MATTVDTLFSKVNGAKWNTGVTFERTNPGPIEKYSVFQTLEAAQSYASTNVVAYPGQIVAVVDKTSNEVSTYKINIDGSLTQIDKAIAAGDLPIASQTNLGAVKIGTGLQVAADGTISAQKLTVDQTITGNESSANPASSKAVAAAVKAVSDELSSKVAGLDMAEVTIGAGETVKTIKETDGVVSVTKQAIKVEKAAVNGLATDLANLSTAVNAKLAKSDHDKFVNEVGLSAATTANPVVTKQDIADLAGAMHFKGVTATDLSTGSKVAPTDVYGTGETPKAGDIVINETTLKEFIWGGTTPQWNELGHEGTYVTNAEYTTKVGELAAADAFLSGAVDAAVKKVDGKIFIGGEKTDSLSVYKVSQDEYHEKVVAGTIKENELYVVSSDTFNMYDERIVNLAAPTEDTDAANKVYVDTAVAAVTSKVNSLSASQLVWDIDCISCGSATTN